MVTEIIAGTLLGILTGLGIGGGSLLLLYLTLIKGMDPSLARGISLLFFFPAAGLSCFKKEKDLPIKKLLPAILFGCLSAAGFSLLSKVLDPGYFKKALGVLFLLIGFHELRTPRKPPQ